MNTIRRLALAAVVALPASFAPTLATAGDVLPGEKTELTTEVRAEAEAQLKIIRDGTGEPVVKARTALLRMGPVVWPVIENAIHLTVTDPPKPHLKYLKALLGPKTEPEFEWLRGRLRRAILIGKPEAFLTEFTQFRAGIPDPVKPSVRVPPKCPTTPVAGGGLSYRSADRSIVIAFGADAIAPKDPKVNFHPDGGDITVEDPTAGFLVVIGGKPIPAPRTSGRGGNAVAHAPQGFAYAWAQNGAKGMKPGGQGGDASTADAKGGAGDWSHPGDGGAGADG